MEINEYITDKNGQQFTPLTWESDIETAKRLGHIFTPWGPADSVEEYAPGIVFYGTCCHGGFKLSEERNAKVPAEYRNKDGFYEEDEKAEIVYSTFPDET